MIRSTLTTAILIAFAAHIRGGPRPPGEAISIGDYSGPKATLLAIDDTSLPYRENLCYYLSTPTVRKEPVLTPSRDNPHATDTLAVCDYATVLQEGEKFRMWYYGLGLKNPNGDPSDHKAVLHEGPICYAESADGLHWIKPKLGQVSHNGGSDNNAIALPAEETEGAFLLKEDDDPYPSRRYKMIYENTSGARPVVDAAISPDGLHWTKSGQAARLLEPSSFYKFNGLYTISAQNLSYFGERGHRSGRQGFIWVSPDFVHWLPQCGESFLLPEPADPNNRGHDRHYVQVHLGVGAFNYGNAMVGLYCQWHDKANPGDWFGRGTTYGDFGLVVSNDGQHFREVVKGHVFMDRHLSPAALPPDVRSEEILTQSGNAIINVGDQTRIYHGRWMNTANWGEWYIEMALATLPRDRWGAVGLVPHASEGSIWSAPLTLNQSGAGLTLNAEGAAGIRVDVADERFGLLPGYSGDNAGTVSADGFDSPVAWPKGNLDPLVGKKIRLLIHLKRGARLRGASARQGAEPRLFAASLTSN